MSLLKLSLDHKPVDVAISKSGTRIAVVSSSNLAVYSLDMSKRPIAAPTMVWQSDALKAHSARHIAFLGDEHVCVLTDDWDEDESSLWISFGEELVHRGSLSDIGRPSTFIPSVDYEKLYVQSQDASFREISPENMPATVMQNLPAFAPETRIASYDDKVRTISEYWHNVLTSKANMLRINKRRCSVCQ